MRGGLPGSRTGVARRSSGLLACGFGLRGATVEDLSQLKSWMRDFDAQGTAEIWNIPISDQVTSPTMRRLKAKGHGVM